MKQIDYYNLLSSVQNNKSDLRNFAAEMDYEFRKSVSGGSVYVVDYCNYFYEGSPEHVRFMNAAHKNKIRVEEFQRITEYEHDDLINSPFVVAKFTNDIGDAGLDYGTNYDLATACPECRGGGIQQDELILNSKLMAGYEVGVCWNGAILVVDRIRSLFQGNLVSGVEFRPVRDRSKGLPVVEGLWQMLITNKMPSMTTDAKIEIDQNVYCHVCKRQGCYLRSQPVYSKDVQGFQDFNETQEWFGAARFGDNRSITIITNDIYQLMYQNKVYGVCWEIVELRGV